MTMPKNKIKYVNIGCGKIFHSDWINIDLIKSSNIINHNIKNALPFANDEIEIIYHSHVLEHLSKSDAENFIKECYRILKPGGKVLVVDWSESFAGLGPKEADVLKMKVAEQIFTEEGFSVEKGIEAGEHHYGFVCKLN